MTQTYHSNTKLDEIMLILDEQRGRFLELRKMEDKDSDEYKRYSSMMRLINSLKKQIANVFDTDQLPLGL